MIERITPDNQIQPRHAGMMAVLRNGDITGPIRLLGEGRIYYDDARTALCKRMEEDNDDD